MNDIATSSATPVTVTIDPASSRRAARWVIGIVVFIVFVSVVIPLATAGFGMYVAWRSVSEVAKDGETAASALRSLAATVTPGPVAPAALGAIGGFGWKTLDVASPPSGWAKFEPVGDLKWAMSIATAWQPDARLTRIDVSRLTSRGTIDLAGTADDSAGYRFESPSQIDAWKKSARNGESDPQAGHELMVKLSQQQVTALVVSGKPSASDVPPAPVDSLSTVQLMSAARKKPPFAQPSFFDGYMIYNEREGWVWYLTGRGFDESFPRLRARDAKPYPFR